MLYVLAFCAWFCAVMAIRAILSELQEAARQREIDRTAYMTAAKLAASIPPIRVAGVPFRYQRWLDQ